MVQAHATRACRLPPARRLRRREVGGDRVSLHQILQANTDPHAYEPRPRDTAAFDANAERYLAQLRTLDAGIAKCMAAVPSEQRLAEALARETGARSDYELHGDTLGPEGSAGDTYLKMEAANADAMVRGFTGGARGCTPRG
jgi:ABC-type Zn uptake system ZnuABC Zn-binding protein ZnuA